MASHIAGRHHQCAIVRCPNDDRSNTSIVFSLTSRLGFSGKVTLGFAAVVTVSALSMGVAYLAFTRIAEAISSNSEINAETDLYEASIVI